MTGRTVKLGGGQIVPYPEPTSAAATKIGKANKRVDTKAEIHLRSELHRMGLRFRKDMLIRAGDVRTHPDIVFTKAKVAVFVDGCFWHMCPDHCVVPKSNCDYWVPKLEANVARDRRVTAALEGDGWTVVRVWEHSTAQFMVACVRTGLLDRSFSPGSRLQTGEETVDRTT